MVVYSLGAAGDGPTLSTSTPRSAHDCGNEIVLEMDAAILAGWVTELRNWLKF